MNKKNSEMKRIIIHFQINNTDQEDQGKGKIIQKCKQF